MAHKVDTVRNSDGRSVEIHWHAGGRIEIRLPLNEDMLIEAAFLPLGSGRRNRSTIVVHPWPKPPSSERVEGDHYGA